MGGWLERHRLFVVAALLAIILPGAILLWLKRPRPAPFIISTPVPTSTSTPVLTPTLAPTPTPMPVRVYVTGAVLQPDVYLLPAGSIVKDALLAAGGATADADLERINLAVQLFDQQQIYVPYRGQENVPVPPVSNAPTPTGAPADAGGTQRGPGSEGGAAFGEDAVFPVNINTASAVTLETLPGIGPAYAQRIIDYRIENGAFASIEELTEVRGIGPATLAKLEHLITVD
jgi:competence protein ComEA